MKSPGKGRAQLNVMVNSVSHKARPEGNVFFSSDKVEVELIRKGRIIPPGKE